jgi:alpha-tubulin suppressor-like RCC1 family protein
VAVYTAGVLSGKTIKSITVGGDYTCAIASDNLAYCWGYNNYGQIGDNSTTTRLVPVAVYTAGVLSGKTIKSISAGYDHTCVIASNNLAYCWGFNTYGELGNNLSTPANNVVPVAVYTAGVLSGKTIASIEVGDDHTCAVASDSKVYCWGFNSSGQVGDNSTTNRLAPVAVYTAGVLSGKTITSASASGNYACVIASDVNAYCWGQGTSGQLGNNAAANSSVPVATYIFPGPF